VFGRAGFETSTAPYPPSRNWFQIRHHQGNLARTGIAALSPSCPRFPASRAHFQLDKSAGIGHFALTIAQVLYRFRPWFVLEADKTERKTIAELKERVAWFSCPLKFNDPQDSSLGPQFTGGKGDYDRLFSHAFADPISLARAKRVQLHGIAGFRRP
jgi:hypothetical protein